VVNDGNSGNNYSYTFVPDTAGVINARALTVRADDKTRPMATPNPPFTAAYTGFVAADGPADLGGTLVLSTPAVLTSPAGAYSIVAGGHAAANYLINYVDGVLTVTPGATAVTPELDQSYQAALVFNSQPDRSGLVDRSIATGLFGMQGAQFRSQQVREVESTGIRLPAGLLRR
jgi:hypothetical protein